MKPRIIIISDSDPRKRVLGGVPMYAKQLADRLHVHGFPVTFIGKMQAGPDVDNVAYDVLIANKTPGQKNTRFLQSLYRIAKTIKTGPDTIVHAQRPDWLVPFAKHPGRKVVTLHGSHYKNMRLKKGPILRFLYKRLEKQGLALADAIIAVDRETQKEYAAEYQSLASRIVFIPVGVDTNLFHPGSKAKARTSLDLPASRPVFLYVGRFSPEKNIPRMIENLKPGETLVLIGAGEEEKSLRAQASGKDVRILAPMPSAALVDYFVAADAFLLLSSHEGMPTVVLEAWACGCPIVATRVGELPRIIKPGVNGFLVDDYVRDAMDKALAKSARMKLPSRKSAEQYEWSQILESIISTGYRL